MGKSADGTDVPGPPIPGNPKRLGSGDAGEILTLQRAAFVTEAQLYGDLHLPPLTQTIEDLRAELLST